ncbi:MAG TPA: M14 family zinc carboxypeptidase, partial [Gaiellaceae bacterium]|nr:M14 family zinc carboxypeptidase [Gaiellaceae bacterium]
MRRRITRLALGVAAVAVLLATFGTASAFAQQVTGLQAVQRDGFTTLTWSTVAGATDYQIERTPVDEANTPTGTAVIAGVWRPNRTITPESPAFADAGYNPGDRFQWRVRARFGTTPQPFSDPVFGTTLPEWGDPAAPGESLRTQWEDTNAAQFTNDVNEYAYTAALDAASERVRVVEIGRTLLDRPINMFVIGYPAPPATAEEISDSPTALVNCNVHGNEPSSREACLILARELAFGNDARTIDVLSNTTVLLVPSINGDGRAANQRGNSTGQDLNRDYSLIRQPETFSFVEMLRDYTPQAAFDGHEFGNNNAGDLPVLPPRHLNVAQSI